MQTKVDATAQQSLQKLREVPKQTKLVLNESEILFEDSRPIVSQMKATQAMMAGSPRNQRLSETQTLMQSMRQTIQQGKMKTTTNYYPLLTRQNANSQDKPLAANRRSPVQRIAYTNDNINAIAKNQKQLWQSCEPAIASMIKASSFGDAETRHEICVAAKSGGDGMLAKVYGATAIYKWDESAKQWSPVSEKPDFSDSNSESYCIYIGIYMGANKNEKTLYSTFLHEWNAHALPAIGLIANNQKVLKNDREWEVSEHNEYSALSDEALKASVDTLLNGKSEDERDELLASATQDRNSYKSK